MLLEIDGLCTSYKVRENDKLERLQAVTDVSFSLEEGRSLGLVGESGCGKTTVIESILRLLPDNADIDDGAIMYQGEDILPYSEEEIRDLRWEEIAYIPQSAMGALDPVEPTGKQIREVINTHRDMSKADVQARVQELFELVGLDPHRTGDYPHQFSGGMRQRVVIAMALALDPDLIIADEMNTGLDVIVQDKIFGLLEELIEDLGISLVFVSHDISLISELCDDIGVMYAGRLVEHGSAEDVLSSPSHPYTMGLKNSFADVDNPEQTRVSIPGSPPDLVEPDDACQFVDRCPFATSECEDGHPPLEPTGSATTEDAHLAACYHADDADRMRSEASLSDTWGADVDTYGDNDLGEKRLEVTELRKWYTQQQKLHDVLLRRKPDFVKAVDGVSFDVREREIVGIAGESGCGKSTLGEALTLLTDITDGEISIDGESITGIEDVDMQAFRRDVQIIFQDPFESLNPRSRVLGIVGEPLKVHDIGTREERRQRIEETLDRVGLPNSEDFLTKFPHNLSGGQRQRLAIARALVLNPDVLVCDEPTSMLDVSLQASILSLLKSIARNDDVSVVLISHDIASLQQACDRICIMYLGKFVEIGDATDVVADPQHPYTRHLAAAIPSINPTSERERVMLKGEPNDPIGLPDGCIFAPRCPDVTNVCHGEHPALQETLPGHSVGCYHVDGYSIPEKTGELELVDGDE